MEFEPISMMVWLGLWIGCLMVGYSIGAARGRAGAGVLCALILGPLGLIVAMFLPKDQSGLADADRKKGRKPGQPTQRHRTTFKAADPIEAWEKREMTGKKLPPL